ncbi:MAG: thioesterase family protein [Acidimicrobiaceae bacterium]|nr:thioesterase family protein [Acidimicrobiaceae bacterium]
MSELESVLLADAAAVEPDGEGRYVVHLSGHFTVFDYPNGGYLQCVMASAALAAASDAGAPHLHATAVTTNFISAPVVGPALLRTEVRRVGRGVSFVHVALLQEGVVTTEALVTVGTLSETSRKRYQSSLAPEIAPLENCVELPAHEAMSIHHSVELRCDPQGLQWWNGDVGAGELQLWLKLTDGGGPWSPWSLLFATDVLPPATLPLGSTGWVPTLQLTSYVRRIPASDWLRARQWCVVVADGLVDERCELFDETGELVAVSSQLAMVRFGQN